MHIWFGFAAARDKETLMREAKQGQLIEISSDNMDEASKLIGWMVCGSYDLIHRVQNGIDDVQSEEDARRIMLHPLWGGLKEFGYSQLMEAKNMGGFGVEIACGTEYHELVDLMHKAKLQLFGGAVTFAKIEEQGLYKEARVKLQ